MAGEIELRIVTPEKGVATAQADEVTLPGAEGYFGVLPNHAPLLTYLDIGEISYKAGGETYWFAVSGGFAEVLRNRVTVLAEHCEPANDIDLERAEDARKRAEEILRDARSKEYAEATARLRRAVTRIQVAGRR